MILAVHVYLSKYSPRELRPLSEDSARQVPPPGIHPLVRRHPENGTNTATNSTTATL